MGVIGDGSVDWVGNRQGRKQRLVGAKRVVHGHIWRLWDAE